MAIRRSVGSGGYTITKVYPKGSVASPASGDIVTFTPSAGKVACLEQLYVAGATKSDDISVEIGGVAIVDALDLSPLGNIGAGDFSVGVFGASPSSAIKRIVAQNVDDVIVINAGAATSETIHYAFSEGTK